MSQINKLSKSFQIEDIIRYSVVFIDEKNNLRNESRKMSSFENNGYRRSIKRSSTLKSNDSFQRLNMKTVSTRTSINNANNMVSSKFKILRTTKKENSEIVNETEAIINQLDLLSFTEDKSFDEPTSFRNSKFTAKKKEEKVKTESALKFDKDFVNEAFNW